MGNVAIHREGIVYRHMGVPRDTFGKGVELLRGFRLSLDQSDKDSTRKARPEGDTIGCLHFSFNRNAALRFGYSNLRCPADFSNLPGKGGFHITGARYKKASIRLHERQYSL